MSTQALAHFDEFALYADVILASFVVLAVYVGAILLFPFKLLPEDE